MADDIVERRAAFRLWEKDDLISQVMSLEDQAASRVTEIESLRAALKPFLGDATMEGILWGDLPDDATGSVTVQLKHFRAARRALTPVAETPNQDGKI